MGGCRCSFRDCQNSSANTMKTMHFFHYPHKDKGRVAKWCSFAAKESFMSLPPDKLRNKVVCEQHFRIACFMNINKERLTKTAVPTLLVTNFGGIVDLEKYNYPELTALATRYDLEEWGVTLEPSDEDNPLIEIDREPATEKVVLHNNILSKQTLMDPLGKQAISLCIDKLDNFETVIVQPQDVIDEQTLEAEKTPSPKPPTRLIRVPRPKFLNHKVTVFERTMTPPMKRAKLAAVTPTSGQATKLVPISLATSSTKNSFQEISSTEEPERSYDANPSNSLIEELVQMKEAIKEQIDCYADFKSCLTSSVGSIETSAGTIQNQLEHSKRQLLVTQNHLMESQKQLAKAQKQLNDLLVEQKAQHDATMERLENLPQTTIQSTLNSSDGDFGKVEKNSMKKVQLFNGIKRYLNPTAVALLRMEMFGSAERPYKSDEKSFAVELLNLGAETYDYFTDEWRFRLPSKQTVKTWINENDEDEDV